MQVASVQVGFLRCQKVLCAMCYVLCAMRVYSPLSPPVEARRLLQVDMPDARRGAASAASAPFSPRCRPRGCAAARQPPLSLSGRDPRRWDAAMDRAGIAVFDVRRRGPSNVPSPVSYAPSLLPLPPPRPPPCSDHKVLSGTNDSMGGPWGLLEVHVRMCVRQKEMNIEH